MASIKIHQDIYNFERKRKGFTTRQITALSTGCALSVGTALLLGYALRVPAPAVSVLCLVPALPAITAGFLPIRGMPAEEFASRLWDLSCRGGAIVCEGESAPPLGCETTREYRKLRKRKGAEIVA